MVKEKLEEKDIEDFEVMLDFSEAWTTDWMTDEAKVKLKDYGIAPPEKSVTDDDFLKSLSGTKIVPCPFAILLKQNYKASLVLRLVNLSIFVILVINPLNILNAYETKNFHPDITSLFNNSFSKCSDS